MVRHRHSLNLKHTGRHCGMAFTAGLLCASMAFPPSLAGEGPAVSGSAIAKTATGRLSALSPQQKALHALNRFTFGPTPGELASVQRQGLDAWFNQQLHPERIDDHALEVRLDQFPAMRLSQPDLVAHYPTPGMLRRFANGALLLPSDPTERAVYADASLNYEERKQAKAEKKADAAGTKPPGEQATGSPASPMPIPAKPAVGKPGGDDVPGPAPMDPSTRNVVLNLPPQARMQRLFAMQPAEMISFQDSLKGPDRQRLFAGLSPAQTEQVLAMRAPERMIVSEVMSARLLRDVYSQRQLQAVMTDFWLNHFSVYLHKNQNEPYLLPAYERDVVLPNSLGRFEDLLVATAKSPAMLVYLDNWQSIGPDSRAAQRAQMQQARNPDAKVGKRRPQGINENYARELMELHTLGVKGGYTQADVIEVAKCFTGWTIDRPDDGGEFLFNPNRHEPGDKTVLGHVIHESGMNEGLEVLHILATSPSTAHFVSLKLAQRFVSDTPPPALVDRMAKTYLGSQGDIRAVLLTMFHSPEFWSPENFRAKVKTPVEFVASALRATDAQVTNAEPLVQAMNRLGMPVYGMQTPNGYSWQAEDWVSSNALLTRMNFALVLAGSRLQGTLLDWSTLLGGTFDPSAVPDAEEERKLELVLLGQPASVQTRQAALSEAATPGVQQEAEQSFRAIPVSTEMVPGKNLGGKKRAPGKDAFVASVPETPLATTAGLLMGSPDFQRR